jgi:hypothetical protein
MALSCQLNHSALMMRWFDLLCWCCRQQLSTLLIDVSSQKKMRRVDALSQMFAAASASVQTGLLFEHFFIRKCKP